MTARSIGEAEEAELVRLYAEGKMSTRDLGVRFDCSINTVNRTLERLGIQRRPPGPPRVPEEEAQEFRRLYVDENMGTVAIGVKMGRHDTVVATTLRRLGVEIRQPGRYIKPPVVPVGTIYGRLTTVSDPYRVRTAGRWAYKVDVKCECGTVKSTWLNDLGTFDSYRKIVSCGCFRQEMRGPKAPGWKGGWYLHRGYRGFQIRRPDGSQYGVLEHILVMERRQGRPLGPWEEVHHINSVAKTDNDHFCKDCGAEWPELESDGLLHCECGWSAKPNLQLRITAHGAGSAYACSDCGSARIHPVPLTDPDNRHVVTQAGAR